MTNAGNSLTYDVLNFIPQPAGFERRKPRSSARCWWIPKMENWDNDASKITYVSPRIGGLQLGVSYAPKTPGRLHCPSFDGKHLADPIAARFGITAGH